jgi:hypothetical protein
MGSISPLRLLYNNVAELRRLFDCKGLTVVYFPVRSHSNCKTDRTVKWGQSPLPSRFLPAPSVRELYPNLNGKSVLPLLVGKPDVIQSHAGGLVAGQRLNSAYADAKVGKDTLVLSYLMLRFTGQRGTVIRSPDEMQQVRQQADRRSASVWHQDDGYAAQRAYSDQSKSALMRCRLPQGTNDNSCNRSAALRCRITMCDSNPRECAINEGI